MKRSPMKVKRRPSMSAQERRDALAFKRSTQWDPCAACGRLTFTAAHHVVYQQHLKAEDRWRQENALSVCTSCHEAHHNGSRRIPLEVLSDDNLNFASEVLGLAAGDYLRRRYSGTVEQQQAPPHRVNGRGHGDQGGHP